MRDGQRDVGSRFIRTSVIILKTCLCYNIDLLYDGHIVESEVIPSWMSEHVQ